MRLATAVVAFAFSAIVAVAGEDTPAQIDARRIEKAIQATIARAEPAVACLLVYRPSAHDSSDNEPIRRLDDPTQVPDFYGSGVVFDAQGLILTNYHVVRDSGRIYVRIPGVKDADGNDGPAREGFASIKAADVKSDLAVLKIVQSRGPDAPLATLAIGGREVLKKGSLVVSLGHPYASGYRDGSPSASWGIVSNLRRRQPGPGAEVERDKLSLHHFGTLIQTDVRLQLGTSGGALVDLDGRLVGLTTAQAALNGIDSPGGFAIPMDATMRRIVDVLARGEEVEYGFLGISTDPMASRRRLFETGVEILNVIPNSPAEAAGLQPRDLILKVNGRPVREHDDLFFQLAASLAGRPAELLIRRFGRERTVNVPLVKAPVEIDRTVTPNRPRDDWGIATSKSREWYGLRVEYTSVIKGEPMLSPGVLVREVSKQAKEAGLSPYVDIITHVNDRAVNSPSEFHRAADQALKAGHSLKLTLTNPPRTVTLP